MAIVALVLLAALCAVLVVPVVITLDWNGWDDCGRPGVWVHTRWLFVTWRSGASRARPRAGATPGRVSPRSTRTRRLHWRDALNVPGLFPRFGRLVMDLVRVLAPRVAEARIRVGLDDPVATAMWWGMAHTAVGWAGAAGWRLDVEPEFTGARFEGRAHVEWWVRPGRLLWPVTTFVCSPVVWRAGIVAFRGTRR